jgi:hypothetical protein
MRPRFSVRTVPQFDRLLRRLNDQHPELSYLYALALRILESDPLNFSRQHNIKTLKDVGPGAGGQERLALRRFRFRVVGQFETTNGSF